MPLLMITPRQTQQERQRLVLCSLYSPDAIARGRLVREHNCILAALPLALRPSTIETVAADEDPGTEVP